MTPSAGLLWPCLKVLGLLCSCIVRRHGRVVCVWGGGAPAPWEDGQPAPSWQEVAVCSVWLRNSAASPAVTAVLAAYYFIQRRGLSTGILWLLEGMAAPLLLVG